MPEPISRIHDAQPVALPEPVKTLIDAANASDTEAFLACFTPDGVVDDWGREFHGPAAVRSWSDEEFIGMTVSLTVLGIATDGPAPTITAQVGGQGFTGRSHFTFTVAGPKVARMKIRA